MPSQLRAAEVREPSEGGAGQRELEAVHEIAQAFLAANHPVEVYRLALARLTPMVRSDFAAVFVRDEAEPDMLKPVCAQGWPQSSAKYLGHLRIRVGLGPTGRAVAENASVEVENVFGDAQLADWWEIAKELGFASLMTLPLATAQGVNGAVSFYFAEPRRFNDEERSLLRRISEQLAATTTRARAAEEARLELDQLRREKDVLEKALRHRSDQAKSHDRLILGVCNEIRSGLNTLKKHSRSGDLPDSNGAELLLYGAQRTLEDLATLLELRLNQTRLHTAAEDAVRLARQALETAGDGPAGVTTRVDATESIIPVMTDGPRVTRILASLLGVAYRRTTRGDIVLEISQAHDDRGGSVYWTIAARGIGLDTSRVGNGTGEHEDLDAAIARELTRVLGGEVTFDSIPLSGSVYRLRLPARRKR
jgi:GAF domain-containing protein